MNAIFEAIIKKHLTTDRTSKQSSIIKVMVTSPDCLFARLMSERVVDEAAKLYLNIRVGTAQENIRQLQRRSDSLLLLLNNKSYSTAARQLLDVNPGVKTAIVPVEIGTRDKTVLATLYAEVVKNLEASRLLLTQQTPVIQMLDRPGYLLEDKKKGLFFSIFIGSFIAIFCVVLWMLGVFVFNRTANS